MLHVSEQRPVHVVCGVLQVSEQHGSCGQWSVTGLRTTTGSCGGCCIAGLRTTWGARSTTHSAPSSRRPTPPGCTSWRDPHSSPWSVHSHRPATHIPSSRYWPAHPNGRPGARPLVAAWSLSAGSKPGSVHFNSACPRCHVFNHTSSLVFRHIPPRGKMCLEFGFQSECTWSRVMLFHAVIHIGIRDNQLAHVFKLNIKQAVHLF